MRLRRRKRLQFNTVSKRTAYAFMLVFVVVGILRLTVSHAAAPYASVEAEQGTPAGGASTISDSTASGGSAVTFANGPIFGVLQPNPVHLSTDTAAGLRLAVIEVGWDDWEPTNGTFSQSYIDKITSEITSYAAAGWQVGVSIGLQYTPTWVTQLPEGELINQTGAQSGTPNFEFSQAVRSAASSYMENIVSVLSGYNISYYRVGLSDTGEMGIGPIANDNDSWWAFDSAAQGTTGGLPSGVPTSPLPGWVPGTTTYDGQAITQTQVQDWYNWYLGAITNAESWEINTYRSAGYKGELELVMPGDGAGPTVYSRRIAADLAAESYDSYNTMNTGTAYQLVLNDIPLDKSVIDISSVQDDGGSAVDDQCQATDAQLPLASADTSVSHWSSVRWLSYLADQHSLSVMGENPGQNSSVQMANTFNEVKSCGLIALQWAFDAELYNGTDASISDYQSNITTNF